MLYCAFQILLQALRCLRVGLAVLLEGFFHIPDILIKTARDSLKSLLRPFFQFLLTCLEHLFALCGHLRLHLLNLLIQGLFLRLFEFLS